MDFNELRLISLNNEILEEIMLWKYEEPYNIYNLQQNEYLKDCSTWGDEQFVLSDKHNIIAYVSCQIIDKNMWVGWSLRPDLCGKGTGKDFVKKCIDELISIKKYSGDNIFLKVISWNTRAIKVYEKLNFIKYDKLARLERGTYVEYHIMKKYVN
ncbi:MAG: GNAT family N-acetyltransferase [Romboutsia sp.]|uniref:GNAT family N-acetyltransferase n=1 Tax=Romboutsia sp. TaxID=1965302 RepID=UPI003F2BDE9D